MGSRCAPGEFPSIGSKPITRRERESFQFVSKGGRVPSMGKLMYVPTSWVKHAHTSRVKHAHTHTHCFCGWMNSSSSPVAHHTLINGVLEQGGHGRGVRQICRPPNGFTGTLSASMVNGSMVKTFSFGWGTKWKLYIWDLEWNTHYYNYHTAPPHLPIPSPRPPDVAQWKPVLFLLESIHFACSVLLCSSLQHWPNFPHVVIKIASKLPSLRRLEGG